MDSNHRSQRQQIYSLPPLAAREPHHSILERVKGIEPSRSAWKAEVLPLNYTRKTFCWKRNISNIRPFSSGILKFFPFFLLFRCKNFPKEWKWLPTLFSTSISQSAVSLLNRMSIKSGQNIQPQKNRSGFKKKFFDFFLKSDLHSCKTPIYWQRHWLLGAVNHGESPWLSRNRQSRSLRQSILRLVPVRRNKRCARNT